MNYWANYPKFMVSLLEVGLGQRPPPRRTTSATTGSPRSDGNYSWMYIFDDMYRGTSTRVGGKEPGPEGFISFGMNPVGLGPNSKKMVAALAKLKWLVMVENVRDRDRRVLEGAQGIRRARCRRRSRRRSSCSRPRTSPRRTARSPTPRAGCNGSGRRSIRRARPKADQEILARILLAVRDLYKKEGARCPKRSRTSPGLHEPGQPRPLGSAQGDQRQGAGRHPGPQGQDEGLEDRRPAGRRVRPAPGRRLDDVRQLAPLGRLHRGGQQRAAALDGRPDGPRHVPQLGLLLAGEPAHHVQPRLRGRATERPGIPKRPGIVWNGEKWVGDVPDIKPDSKPGEFGAFIMLPGGVGRLYRRALNDGPVPGALRSRSRRRSTTRSTPRSRRTRRRRSSPRTRTSTARRRISRSSARRIA